MDADFNELVHPRHSAVLVIDIQNDSCHPDGSYAASGMDISLRRQAAHNAADFIKQARNYGVPVIFTKETHTRWDESASWSRRTKRVNRPPVCVEGTWGEQFYLVEPLAGEAVIGKRRYSCFPGTELDLLLRRKRITTLILTGGGTQACVESTARDGFELDYEIVVVSDCCGTPSLDEHEPALKRMASLCATVVTAKDILEAWS